ncbi:MAG: clan AA aspartic protease [Verrucomicrobia bacterium]|nr:clan AA aspartic protease [Verrucomicrobiota bacterium]
MNRLLQAETSPSASSEFPIQFREGLLWVEVAVPQSKVPLHFLVDTGASASVLNLNTAQRLGLKLGSKVSVTGVSATLTGNWPVKLSAKASGIELPGQFLALDLSKLSGACSRSVDGLVGADFFHDRVVEIDYVAQKLRVLNAVPCGADTNSIPLEVRRCGLRVPVQVNGGKRQWVRLDTGCATAFQWVTSKVRLEKCTSKLAVGLAELAIPQTMTGVRLGDHYLDTVPTGLHHNAIFPGEAGLLGNGLLASFGVVTIDAKSGHLLLGRSIVR